VLKVNYGPKYALFLEKLATISNFSFENMPGYFSQDRLTSRDVHSYNYEDKQFSIESYRNDVTEAMAVYKKNYVDCMKGDNGNPPTENFIPGAYRTLRKNIQNVFTVVDNVENQRLSFGRNKFLFNSVFMNNIINFKVPGSSHRQSGKFIAIERDDAVASSDFDNKLLKIIKDIEKIKYNFDIIFIGNKGDNKIYDKNIINNIYTIPEGNYNVTAESYIVNNKNASKIAKLLNYINVPIDFKFRDLRNNKSINCLIIKPLLVNQNLNYESTIK